MNKKALGKGLRNLIPTESQNSNLLTSNDKSGIKQLNISDVIANPKQPREHFSEEALNQLADTIRTHGLIQPIVVKNHNGKYEIISGERRYRASKLAGLLKIPAIIRETKDEEVLELALIENIQRENLNPIEEALAYKQLTEKNNIKITDLATRVGKNRTTISNLIRLLQLPYPVIEFLKKGNLNEGQARPLLSLPDENLILNLAKKIVNENWSVRKVETIVSEFLNKKSVSKETKKNIKEPSIDKFEAKIRKKFSTKVDLNHNSKTGKGKLVIHYNSIEIFENILKTLDIK